MEYEHLSRADERPPRREPEPERRDRILALQRSAGNAAVGRALLQRAERDDRFYALEAASDWAGLAQLLLAADEPWMVGRLKTLDADQLRFLDDAVRRAGVLNSRLRVFIKAGLRFLGADDDQSAPGGGYGEIEARATDVHDGALHPGHANGPAWYTFEITFRPRSGMVNADEINFIQTARAVSTAAGTIGPAGELDWDNAGANGPGRQTGDHTRVDQIQGREEGWYDDGLSQGIVRSWRPGAKQPAWMQDTPKRSSPNVDFTFESAVVCRRGADAGKVYATATWGFTIDAAMKVQPKNTKVFNKASPELELAVTFWNAEAEGPHKSAPHQHQLPAPLR